MKKAIILIAGILIAASSYGQNRFKYPIYSYSGIRIGSEARIGSVSQIDSMNVVDGTLVFYVGPTAYYAEFDTTDAGGSMVYPGAGIPLSTGSAWGTSITNNSSNWNTAYGWGDHSAAGYATQTALQDTASALRTTISGLGGGHDAVTLAGTPDYLTLSGQIITRNQIDLTTDVSGILPDANVANDITITNLSQVQDVTATASEINTPLDGALVTLTEFRELETIGTTTISAQQWVNLGTDQYLERDSAQTLIFNTTFFNETTNAAGDSVWLDPDTTATGLATAYDLTQITGGTTDTTYLHFRIDSLSTALATAEATITTLSPPAVNSAEMGTINDSIIVVVMSKNLYGGSVAATTDFAVTEDGNAYGVNSVAYGNDTIYLTLDSIGATGSTYLLDYDPGTNQIMDSTGNWALAWIDQAVTNNIAATSNMISNGTFDNSTGWTEGAGWTIAGGNATFDDATTSYLSQADGSMISSIQTSTAYTLTFDLTGTSGAGIYMRVMNSAGTAGYSSFAEYTNGPITINFTTPADIQGGGISFLGSTDGASGGTIDNAILTAD